MPQQQTKWIFWDVPNLPVPTENRLILWRAYGQAGDGTNIVSIPSRIDLDPGETRTQYLKWICRLGSQEINGRSVVDQLRMRDDLSYWWMTSLAQKFTEAADSVIIQAIKILEFERISGIKEASELEVHTQNEDVAQILLDFCHKNDIRCVRVPHPLLRLKNGFWRRVVKKAPHMVRTVAFMIWYFSKHLKAVFSRPVSVESFNSDISFFDILTHLRGDNGQVFRSNYWTELVPMLKSEKIQTNWLHLFYEHRRTKTYSEASGLIEAFNRGPNGLQNHSMVEGQLSVGVFIGALRDYCRLIFKSRLVIWGQNFVRPEGSQMDLWPLFRDEYRASLVGPRAFRNCIYLRLFENICEQLPIQKMGVYLQENQPWEISLLYAWKRYGHGEIIGVPHSTIRYWDLRYHFHPDNFDLPLNLRAPAPDKTSPNGPVSMLNLVNSGCPESNIRVVEALRFLYLNRSRLKASDRNQQPNHLRILVVGEVTVDTNEKLLSWIKAAIPALPSDSKVVFKPHPALGIGAYTLLGADISIFDGSISDALSDCNVVFAGPITSASVDAYCSHIPVVQMLNPDSFNMSPLVGLPGIKFVSTSNDLPKAIMESAKSVHEDTSQYFFLDNELPRWRSLVSDIPR